MDKDYYSILGVSKDASEQDIKNSFRKLSRKYHPDMQSGKSDKEKKEAEEKFKEIAAAYEVLSDKDKRQQYDMYGANGQNMNFSEGVDINDFLKRHASMFGSMFADSMFGEFGNVHFSNDFNNANSGPTPSNGANVKTSIDITFKESLKGCTKEFDIKSTEECKECNGTGIEKGTTPTTCNMCNGTGVYIRRNGIMTIQTTCPHCKGSGKITVNCKHCTDGRVNSTKHIKVNIPAGIDNGQTLRVKNGGHCGLNGGANGNLYINVNVKPSQLFSRQNNNILTIKPISPIVASLGGKIEIHSPFDTISINIPPGTKSGTKFKIHGKGVNALGHVGDLIVEVKIEPFTALSKEQKEMLKLLDKSMTKDNYEESKELERKIDSFNKQN